MTTTTPTKPEAAASPFLTVDQAATELGVVSVAVQRLIAIGKLKAYRVPPDKGPWKIRPADFEAYVVAGCPNLAMPALTHAAGWYDDRTLDSMGRAFEAQVRKIINDNIPTACPLSAIKVGETYPVAVPAAAMTVLRQLADAPASAGLVKMPGAQPSPFKNAGQQFLAAEMQRRVEKFATPAPNDAVNHGQTRITKLFDSPEAYRGILDQAWAELSKVVFSVRRDYRVDTLGNSCTVSFEVGYTTIATSALSSFEALVF